MWASDAERNQIGLLGLVASDFTYKRSADILFDPDDPTRGEFLASFPDSLPNDEYSFPPRVAGTSNDPSDAMFATRTDQAGVGVVLLPNWQVFNVIEGDDTGFGVVIFRGVYAVNGQPRTDYLVAFRGTDGRNGQDWFANMQLGLNQWRDAAGQLSNILRTLTNADNTDFSGTIHFTGQSLGGALAQYAAYEYALALGDAFSASRISLTTFNAFAGGAGLLSMHGADPNTGYDETRLAGVSTAHYTIENDIVHAFGAAFVGREVFGHLNARDGDTTNLYHFGGFRTFVDNQPQAGEQNFLSLVEGHRIESGFYAGMDRYSESLADADVRAVIPYVDTGNLQQIGEVFARIFGGDRSNTVSAWSRVAVGTLVGGLIANPKQFQALLDVVADSLYNSGDIGFLTKSFIKSGIPNVLLKAFALPVVKIAGAGLFLASLADLMDKRAESDGSAGYASSFLPSDSPAIGISIADQDPYNARASATRFGVALAAINPEAIKDPGLQAITAQIQSLELSLNEFGSVLYAGGDWLHNTAHYLHAAAQAKGIANEALALFDANLAAFLAAQIDIAGAGDEGFISSARTQLAAFVREDLGWALANANVEFATPYQLADSGFSATVNDFQDYSQIEAALRVTLSDSRFTNIHGLIREALTISDGAWQTVVVAAGHSDNPFDDADYAPNEVPLPAANLTEGSAQPFTAYLPFEAPAGGQRIRLTLTGGSVDKLTLFGGDESQRGPDGTFTVTIAEGQRQISFAIAALEDVDADETFALSAQLVALVDGNEVATHLVHEEATLLVEGDDETVPAGGMEYHGDWGLKLFPGTDDPMIDFRYPHIYNLERDPAQPAPGNGNGGHPIVGHEGADHIWTGGHDVTLGAGGDDYIEGKINTPNTIRGDYSTNTQYGEDGDDIIEGGENAAVHFPDGHTFNGVKIETSGDDIILGEGGDDHLYADRIALLGELLDPATQALDMLGDWISGGLGDDRIFGSAAHDALFGGGGADVIRGGAGDDVLDGDDNYEPLGPPFWEIDTGDFGVVFYPVTNIYIPLYPMEYYRHHGGDDVLDGGTGDDWIFGMLGNDTLIGGAGEDHLEGWEGDDQLFGGNDDDVLAGDFGRYEQALTRFPQVAYRVMPGVVNIYTADGSEIDQAGNDFLDGGGGNDRMYGDGGGDSLFGRDGADLMYGDATYLPEELHGRDFLDGGAGADSMFGGGGDDELFGGAGNDSISGDGGDDYADGGAGEDILSGGEGDDVLKGGDGNDVLTGDAGADVLEGGDGADQLAGGADDDVLGGGAGADLLDGGDGSDALFGGLGDDVLLGGEGDDRLDGGSGVDVLQGGGGNDTYVFGLGYGQDLIEDNEGVTRLVFGAGIEANDLSVSLDAQTLTATIQFGGVGDSATLNLDMAQVGGVDFANGAAWHRKEFLAFMPALVSAGSGEGDVLVGNEKLRNDLRGFGGDDFLLGSANDDVLAGGEGADSLDGAAGSDLYRFAADHVGIDVLADSAIQARAYLEWYYGNLGISDWMERGLHGGQYSVFVSQEGDSFTHYYGTAEEAAADHPFAEISFIEPLPSLAPLLRRDDEAGIESLVEAGVLWRDAVEFGDGLALSELTLRVTVDAVAAAGHPDQPWHDGALLSVRWAGGEAGFDLQVPGITYGFSGADLLRDGIDSDIDGSWRGYRLGESIEAFRFADGTSYSLEAILRQAEVVQTVAPYGFSRNSGEQLISLDYAAVRFDDDIRWQEIAVSRDGVDLVLDLGDGSAQGRITGWYADPDSTPQLVLQFSSDPEVSAELLTALGLEIRGTDADDVLTGTDDFGEVLYGGAGNDVLDGGAGKDTYVFRRGDGTDQITEIPAGAGDPEASVIVLEDFFAWEAHFGLGSLLIELGDGDALHFTGFDALDPYSTPVFEQLKFAEGESLSYADVIAMGFEILGTDEGEVLTGTGVNDFIDGAGGDDTLQGFRGDDVLQGGEGSDVYVYAAGDGNDHIVEWDETPGEVDTLRLHGIAPEQVRVTRDDYSYYLVLDTADRIMLDSAAREAVAQIERIEFDDETVWTPVDLAERVELLPGTERDDPLWGTPQDDVIYGLGGSDALFGNGGADFLAGGEGSDIYMFAPGDGADVIDNYDEDGSPDYISFSAAASTDATLTRRGNDLVLTVENGGNQIALRDWYADANRKIYGVFFEGDFVSWDAAILEELAPVARNAAPEVANPLPDQTANEDEAFIFVLPEGTFSDPDADDLAYGASLSDGSALPGWLAFDSELQIFSGTPANSDVATLEIALTATDAAGETATEIFALEVLNTNDAPVVVGAIADLSVREGQAIEFGIPANVFADPDVNDSLALLATLPPWLSFDGGVVSGAPGFSDAGEYVIEITASDAAGASAATSFRLTVTDVPSTGNELIGTRHDDVLNGTGADEVLRGRGGNDRLLAGGGDDVLHGGRGDDVLRGGTGNDVYVHRLHGGDDEIVETGEGVDVLRFGQGITRNMVSARRRHDDLVLDVSGPHGSVTVRGWFASPARRIEFVEFANGAVWNESKIRNLVRDSDAEDAAHDRRKDDFGRKRDDKPSHRAADESRDGQGDRAREDTLPAVWQRLSRDAPFDFETLLRESAGADKQQHAPTPQEIARQWAAVHRYANALAFEADETGPGAGHFRAGAGGLAGVAGWGFGFEASVGMARAQDGLKALEGLGEGFRKL